MTTIDAHRHVLSVVAGTQNMAGPFLAREFIGTAFPIGNDLWLTAGHVAKAVQARETLALAWQSQQNPQASVVTDKEINDDLDIAVLVVREIDADILAWSKEQLAMTRPVKSVGFPYALNPGTATISIRAFGGGIVSAGVRTSDLPGRPKVYELPFQCPRGLSGAPLFTDDKEGLLVRGVIVGNHSTEMLVYSDREEIRNTRESTIVERYEKLQLGIAVQAESLLEAEFDLLSGTLEKHMSAQGLLID